MRAAPSVERVVSVAVTVFLCCLFALLALAPPLAAQSIMVKSATPASGEQGAIGLEVTIDGEGFEPGATVDFLVSGTPNPGGIVVKSVKVQGSRKIVTTVDIAPDATVSSFDVKVTLRGGRSGKGTDLFRVSEKVTGNPANQPPPPLAIQSTSSIATLGGPIQVLQPVTGEPYEVTWWQTGTVAYQDVAFGDVDRDGTTELVAARARCGSGSVSKRKCWMAVDVFREGSTGEVASIGPEISNSNSPYSVEVLLADLHPAPGREIVLAAQRGVGVLRFDAASGALVVVWSTTWSDGFFKSAGSLGTGDLDGDGLDEILLGSTLGFVRVYSRSGDVWNRLDTASTADLGLPPWLYRAHVADLDGDSVPEMLAVAWSSDSTRLPVLAVWSRDAGGLWRVAHGVEINVLGADTNLKIAVANMDGDPSIEIAFVAKRRLEEFRIGVWEWTGSAGAELELAWQQALGNVPSNLSLDDVDGDGAQELIVSGSHLVATGSPGEVFYLEVFDWDGIAGASRWERILDCGYVVQHAVR